MKKVIIIGAGFAGLSAATILSKCGLGLEITLLDKKDRSGFLPFIPDCIGRGFNPELLGRDVASFCRKLKIEFIKEEAASVYLKAQQVCTQACTYSYDFLIIASGCQTNFFSNQDALRYGFSLNSITDAEKINNALNKDKFENFIICGGGYTGIEAATNFWLYFKKKGLTREIIIVERAPRILGPLPEWMKVYVEANLKKMNIEILTNTVIEKIEAGKVTLSQGGVFNNSMLIWVPGVSTADFIQKLEVNKNPQGRMLVDEYLRLDEYCFCAGDTALFGRENNYLRMSVQFARQEGRAAADNIINSIKNIPLKKFQPWDPGYIIPMANNISCGKVFGLNTRGILATLLHFTTGIFYLPGFRNKVGVIKNLIMPGQRQFPGREA